MIPSKPTSASVPKKSSQGTSPWPMLRCWWTRACGARRVQDVAQAGDGLVVEGVADMDMRQHVGAFAQHRLRVVAEVEGVRRAVEELDVLRVDGADDVDRRLQRLAPVLGVRLDVELDPLALEDRHELLHRAPPGVLAGLDHRAGVAAVAGALVRMRAAAELGVHRVDAQLDGDLDGALPVLARRPGARPRRSRPSGTSAAARRCRRWRRCSAFLKALIRSGKTRGALNHSRKSARGLSSIHS